MLTRVVCFVVASPVLLVAWVILVMVWTGERALDARDARGLPRWGPFPLPWDFDRLPR